MSHAKKTMPWAKPWKHEKVNPKHIREYNSQPKELTAEEKLREIVEWYGYCRTNAEELYIETNVNYLNFTNEDFDNWQDEDETGATGKDRFLSTPEAKAAINVLAYLEALKDLNPSSPRASVYKGAVNMAYSKLTEKQKKELTISGVIE